MPSPVEHSPPDPGLRHRLSTRIIVLSLAALMVVLGMISGTLWLSWKLEGAGAAINDAGSLRMRANRVAIEAGLASLGRPNQLPREIEALDATLALLRRGSAARPLFLPDEPAIHAQLDRVARDWNNDFRPLAATALHHAGDAAKTSPAMLAYVTSLPGFIDQADRLVTMIERDNARKTDLLRLSQTMLAGIACMGTVAVIYLLYLWIILPVLRLQDGLRRMAARELTWRLPVESRDEFGTLATGFNRMASELEGLYTDLEARVQQKTAELERRAADLEALYDMAAFLNQPSNATAMAAGFLERVMARFDADGGTVRAGIDADQGNLHLLASAGLSPAQTQREQCLPAGACHCGRAAREGVVSIVALDKVPAPQRDGPAACARDGFVSLAAFRIASQGGVAGVFTLHFRTPRELPAFDRQLLEALGQHLGAALEQLRLSASARQLAVVEERNLVAQGLHDSIAQGLNFLNLQVQLLDAAVNRADLDETSAIVPLLRHGVEESYQDVRELLLNFRSRLTPGQMRVAIEETVARFRRQCRTEATLTIDDDPQARPLQPEQQLQVLFILQEALSNVRKHAMAEHVSVTLHNGRDFRLVVEDDGEGFDPAEQARGGEAHVGLHIMRERAARLSAELTIDTRPRRGVRMRLVLPREASSHSAALQPEPQTVTP